MPAKHKKPRKQALLMTCNPMVNILRHAFIEAHTDMILPSDGLADAIMNAFNAEEARDAEVAHALTAPEEARPVDDVLSEGK
jgi:hypothetical protein